MKYIKTYESYYEYITEFKDYLELDLMKFNSVEFVSADHEGKLKRLEKLKTFVVGKIVTFKGKHEDKTVYDDVKGLISNAFLDSGTPSSYEFAISNYNETMNMNILTYYVVNNLTPIKIYTVESAANKFNI